MNDYQLYLEELDKVKDLDKKPKILIHACCAPCSSEVLDELKDYFDITLFYYNPNIYPYDEYQKRLKQFPKLKYDFKIIEGKYDNSIYDNAIKGLENLGEFSKRCYECFSFRLEEAAKFAKEKGFDFFSTTLSISPYKRSSWINEIGKVLENKYSIKFLYSDFKKKDGYKKSIILSKKFDLYRQEYCGCKWSKEGN